MMQVLPHGIKAVVQGTDGAQSLQSESRCILMAKILQFMWLDAVVDIPLSKVYGR